jgi:hypothetical protein
MGSYRRKWRRENISETQQLMAGGENSVSKNMAAKLNRQSAAWWRRWRKMASWRSNGVAGEKA